MQYQELSLISRSEAMEIFAGDDPVLIAEALIRLALYDSDRAWVEQQCIQFIQHPNTLIQRSAVISIGHVARIHRTLDTETVLPLLQQALENPEVSSYASDTIDDISIFIS